MLVAQLVSYLIKFEHEPESLGPVSSTNFSWTALLALCSQQLTGCAPSTHWFLRQFMLVLCDYQQSYLCQ